MTDRQEQFIDAAIAALTELRVTDLISAVGTRELARRAGLSPASFFYHFESVEEFAAAVLARVFDPGTSPVDSINELVENVRTSQLPVESAFQMHGAEFDRLVNDPQFRIRVGLWSLGGAAADEAYGTYLDVIDQRIIKFTEALFASWGRELRPPYTMEQFVASQVALVHGTAVRTRVSPEIATRDHFARAATSLSLVSLRVRGDRRGMEDRLGEMNYYPLRERSASTTYVADDPIDVAIVEAANRRFVEVGWPESTIASIARMAGVSTSTVYQRFGGKAGLALAVFNRKTSDLFETRTAGAPAEDPLIALLHDLVPHFGSNQSVAAVYLGMRVSHSPDLTHDVLAEHVEATVRSAQKDGAIRPEVEADELAHLIITMLGSRVLERPAEGAARTVEHVERWILKPWR